MCSSRSRSVVMVQGDLANTPHSFAPCSLDRTEGGRPSGWSSRRASTRFIWNHGPKTALPPPKHRNKGSSSLRVNDSFGGFDVGIDSSPSQALVLLYYTNYMVSLARGPGQLELAAIDMVCRCGVGLCVARGSPLPPKYSLMLQTYARAHIV